LEDFKNMKRGKGREKGSGDPVKNLQQPGDVSKLQVCKNSALYSCGNKNIRKLKMDLGSTIYRMFQEKQ
jgi:hypothetical protein